jgi:hypothetical protein
MSGRWEPDPWRRAPLRWWDGSTWTALVHDGRSQYLDPYVPSDVPAPPPGVASEQVPVAAPPAAGAAEPSVPAESAPPVPVGTHVAAAAMDPAPTTPAPAGVGPGGSATGGATGGGARKGQPRWVMALGAAVLIAIIVWFGTSRWRGDDDADTSDAASASTSGATVPVAELPVEGGATTTAVVVTTAPAPIEPVPTADPTTTVPAVDESLVQDCVDVTPSSAFLGDQFSVYLWGAADQDPEVLRKICSVLPTARLEQLSQRRDEIDLAFTGSTVASTVPVPPDTTTTLPSGETTSGAPTTSGPEAQAPPAGPDTATSAP